MKISTNNLAETFSVLRPDLNVDLVKVTPTLYENLDAEYAGFAGHVLISTFEFSSDRPTWERHPAGDEIVLLMSANATLVARVESEDQSIELSEPGSYIVIPRNTWHTAHIFTPNRMMFITPGEGTENREGPTGYTWHCALVRPLGTGDQIHDMRKF